MRKVTRTIAAGAVSGALAAGLVFTAASPALADKAGGSCQLSANWLVKFSVKYEQPNDNLSHISYVAMTSPGAIKKWRVTIVNDEGDAVAGPQDFPNPALPARVDTDVQTSFPEVRTEVWAPSGIHCSASIPAFTV